MAITKNMYSVGELSKASGVSVRTLHHYDEIGLLVPKRNQINDYRIYSQEHAALLRQIILYRNTGMSLDRIKSLVQTEDFDVIKILENQHMLLLQQQENTNSAIQQLEVTMSAAKGEKNLSTLFERMPREKVEEWIDTMRQEEYGNEVFQAYGKISDEQIKAEKKMSDEWIQNYMLVTHLPVSDAQVQVLMKEAYIVMNRMFYNTIDDFEGADYKVISKAVEHGRIDEVSVDIYETYQQGMANHFFEALEYFAEHSLKFNEQEYIHLR